MRQRNQSADNVRRERDIGDTAQRYHSLAGLVPFSTMRTPLPGPAVGWLDPYALCSEQLARQRFAGHAALHLRFNNNC
jgi:hypothetical protein